MTNSKMTRDEIEMLLPEFSLGTLSPEEMLAVHEQLEQYPELQEQLAQLDALTLQIVASSPALQQPSPHVRTQLMSRIESSLQSDAKPQPKVVPTQPSRSTNLWGWRFLAAATAILLLLLAASWLRQRQAMTTLQGQIIELDAAVAELELENGRLQEQLLQEQEILAALTTADQTVPLAATDSAPLASGEFYRSGNEVILVARGLEEPPPQKAYYLWGVVLGPNDEKNFTNLGPVPLDEDGNILFTYTVPPGDSAYDVIDVSLEDASDPPPPILEGDIVLRGLTNPDDEG